MIVTLFRSLIKNIVDPGGQLQSLQDLRPKSEIDGFKLFFANLPAIAVKADGRFSGVVMSGKNGH